MTDDVPDRDLLVDDDTGDYVPMTDDNTWHDLTHLYAMEDDDTPR